MHRCHMCSFIHETVNRDFRVATCVRYSNPQEGRTIVYSRGVPKFSRPIPLCLCGHIMREPREQKPNPKKYSILLNNLQEGRTSVYSRGVPKFSRPIPLCLCGHMIREPWVQRPNPKKYSTKEHHHQFTSYESFMIKYIVKAHKGDGGGCTQSFDGELDHSRSSCHWSRSLSGSIFLSIHLPYSFSRPRCFRTSRNPLLRVTLQPPISSVLWIS